MRRLHLQLTEAKSLYKRIRIADTYFNQRIPCAHNPCLVDAAAREIICKQGCIRIPQLAGHIGTGLRQFERRFVHDLDTCPKVYARIIRFEAAMRKRALSSDLTWTQIAHELEYHDQMHMVHDFQSLSGESPTSLAPHFDLLSSPTAQT